ncbi:MAG: hypothetical protein ACREMZ_11025 [Gemmatimonadales bacterium]
MRPAISSRLQAVAILATVATLGTGRFAQAQDADQHSRKIEGLGRVSFQVSCSAEARRRFEHAMAVLHSFWWEEGDRAFGAVLEADPKCAMAHWGLALNAWGNPFAGGPGGAALRRGAEAAERAAALPAPSRREQGFIAAAAALYRDAAATSNAARLRAYADTMTRLRRDFPNDTEIAIYYSLSVVATAPRTDTTFARQKLAAAILNPLFVRYPNHPGLAHYIIHSSDSPKLAALALDAARRYAQIAPAAPHAQHMPSHIFVRLGLWDETVASNWKSFMAGIAHARATGQAGGTSHELHALDYAVYGYLQRGQDSSARATVATGRELHIPPSQNTLVGDYNRTAMAARVPLETGNWAAAAEFPLTVQPDLGVTAALSRFTRAIGAARSGRVGAARLEVAALDAIAGELERREEPYWPRVAAIKRDAAAAWLRLAQGDTAAALALARTAADSEDVTDKHPVTPAELLPARELQADMLLAARRYQEAREAYRLTLEREPGRARSLFGLGRAAELAGDRATATKAYQAYLQLMSKGDGKRPELATARAFVR